MKIGDVLNAVSTTGSVTATEMPAPVKPVAAADRVTTTEDREFRSSLAAVMTMAATERGSRLQALTREVRSGAYQPSASALADKILASAELDARLAQALR